MKKKETMTFINGCKETLVGEEIDWQKIGQLRRDRIKCLEGKIKELAWQAARENYIEFNDAEYEPIPKFKDAETADYWGELVEKYEELEVLGERNIFNKIESYITDRAYAEDMQLWTVHMREEMNCLSVDEIGSSRGRRIIQKLYKDWKEQLVKYEGYKVDMVDKVLTTNI
jgi:hypothetical protein